MSAFAVVCVALVIVASHVAFGSDNRSSSATGPIFTITNTISSSSTNQIPALLDPGVTRYLWYTAHNPLMTPIIVTSMSISHVTAPLGCSLSNLDYSQTNFVAPPAVPIIVPALGVSTYAVPILLTDTQSSQNSCENRVFHFRFVGIASYSESYTTVSTVVSSLDPSYVGQDVIFTATVSASAVADQDPVPSSPTGTVSFTDGSSTLCSSEPLVSTGDATSTATCESPAYGTPGPHSVTAVYSNSDGNFSGSTSPMFDQAVT